MNTTAANAGHSESGSTPQRRRRRNLTIVIVLVVVIIPALVLLTRRPPAPASPAEPVLGPSAVPVAKELTATDLETFLDGFMPLQIGREDVAGAVIAVVKDGKVLLAKGYGYADVEKKQPVTAEATLFRPGSISKLFTWTAVMQQVEQGKLDLDRDVNEYVDFTIPATFGKPLTLRHIMTHTPGFEETVRELFVAQASDIMPLGTYLSTHLPQQIFPPGTTPAYSNYATALAGHIVERVSGKPFDDYIEEFIFRPLGMTRSTFRQPLPETLTTLMSGGYRRGSDSAQPFELIPAAPAGALSTTAADISRFIIAHLQDGQLGDARILRPETARLMHARQFGLHPELNAMALGFYEESRNGHRIIGHGGDTIYFHSDLHLVLDAGVGFFVSYNSAGQGGGGSPRSALWQQFLDRYFPYVAPAPPTLNAAVEDARAVAGSYIASRRSDTTIFKIGAPLGTLKVLPKPDGTIEVDLRAPLGHKARRWREVGPLLYQETDGQDRIAFVRDGNGRLQLAIMFPAIIFQRAAWNQTGAFVTILLLLAVGVPLLTLVLWPVAALVRRYHRLRLSLDPSRRRLRLLVRLVCALEVLAIGGLAVTFTVGSRDITRLGAQLDPWLHLFQIVGALGAIGVLLVLYNAYRSWTSRQLRLLPKLHDTMMALAGVAYVWFLFTFHLLDFSLKY